MKFAIVHKQTQEIEHIYEADSQKEFGGAFGRKERYVHVLISNDTDKVELSVQLKTGNNQLLWEQGLSISAYGLYPGQDGYIDTPGDTYIIDSNGVNPGESGYIPTRIPILGIVVSADITKVTNKINTLKENIKEQIKQEYDQKMTQLIMKPYPRYETLAFDEKSRAASVWTIMSTQDQDTEISNFLSNPDTYALDCLILFSECVLSGTAIENRSEVEILVNIIQQNSRPWRVLSGKLTKSRKLMHTQIDNTSNDLSGLAQLESFNITWPV